MNFLIIGAKGMLGHAMQEIFADDNPTCWDVDDLDIANEGEVTKKIKDLEPRIIINCAAYTNVDKAEEEKDNAFKVNAIGVKNIVNIARLINAIVIHYSTDYVFDGEKKEGYSEDDIPSNPINTYGVSKWHGEKELMSYDNHYLIRTSWLFGLHGKNFVQTIINLHQTQPELKIVNDQFGKPTYTKDLALATKDLLRGKALFGTYHLVNEPATNWYQFAKKIIELKYPQSKKTIIPVASKEFPRPAKRPHYSTLLNTKRPLLRPWQEPLKEYLEKYPE